MMHCPKHNSFYQGARCQKCIDKEPPYRYSRAEVADPDEWKSYEKMGWTR